MQQSVPATPSSAMRFTRDGVSMLTDYATMEKCLTATAWGWNTDLRDLKFCNCPSLKYHSKMLDIHDTEIQLIEDRILLTYNDRRMMYPDCDCLLDWRKSLINKKALAHQEDSTALNWNEGLDNELTKDLQLTSAFHHLFDHTKFAITDFIYVRKFETEINIEIDKQV